MEENATPISLPEVLTSIRNIITEIQLKNTTLINYYIHPQPIPTEVSGYEPRLKVIQDRIAHLSRLNFRSVQMLIDSYPILLATHIVPNIVQLLHACQNFQAIFVNHYDRRLEQSLPYESMWMKLRYFHDALHQYHAAQQRTRQNPAEAYIPLVPAGQPNVCRGAIAFLNNRDAGKISNVDPKDLLPHHHTRLADRGGVILWWECPFCAFRLRYHASQSTNLNINATDETVVEDSVEDIVFRSSWLVKCHIHHYPREPPTPKPKPKTPSPPPPPVSPTSPTVTKKKEIRRSQGFFIRRISTTITTTAGPSKPKPKFKAKPNSEPEDKKEEGKKPPPPPPPPTGPHNLRFFCPFCLAYGLPLSKGPRPKPPPKDKDAKDKDEDSGDESSGYEGEEGDKDAPVATCFTTPTGLIEHIDERHTRDRPVALLLAKLKVAVRGEMAPGPDTQRAAGRWDLDLR